MALLDLDHFKRFNDTNGHLAGDRLLQATAGAWGNRLRRTDVIARWGGEEFAVLLPDTDIECAVGVVDDLLAVVPKEITCSAGLASTQAEHTVDLLAQADEQLYRAKAAGRARISWAGGMATTSATPHPPA